MSAAATGAPPPLVPFHRLPPMFVKVAPLWKFYVGGRPHVAAGRSREALRGRLILPSPPAYSSVFPSSRPSVSSSAASSLTASSSSIVTSSVAPSSPSSSLLEKRGEVVFVPGQSQKEYRNGFPLTLRAKARRWEPYG